MELKIKVWAGLGVAVALAGAGLSGCTSEEQASEERSEASVQDHSNMAAGESGGEVGGEGHSDVGTLPLPKRLAFMAGHVEAGLALYRAGAAEAAAPHLLHPVSETHAAERIGLDELGFNATVFEEVSAALEQGRPASEIEPQLTAAEANLAAMREKAGGDPAELIEFLMSTAKEEYEIAVQGQVVTDPAEYQDAWGFVVVAQKVAADLDGERAETARGLLERLHDLWPKGAPLPPENPADAGAVGALADRVAYTVGSAD